MKNPKTNFLSTTIGKVVVGAVVLIVVISVLIFGNIFQRRKDADQSKSEIEISEGKVPTEINNEEVILSKECRFEKSNNSLNSAHFTERTPDFKIMVPQDWQCKFDGWGFMNAISEDISIWFASISEGQCVGSLDCKCEKAKEEFINPNYVITFCRDYGKDDSFSGVFDDGSSFLGIEGNTIGENIFSEEEQKLIIQILDSVEILAVGSSKE